MRSTKRSMFSDLPTGLSFIAILTICIVVSILRLSTTNIVYSDGYIWMPLAEEFLENVSSSDGRHRPLFALPAAVLSLLMPAQYAWIIINLLSLLLIGCVAYAISKLLNQKNIVSLSFAFISVTGREAIAWLNHAMINTISVLAVYFALYIYIKYICLREKVDYRIITSVFSVIGLLMLGKAEFGVSLSLLMILFIKTRKVNICVYALLLLFIPTFIWASILSLFGEGYGNYEIERADYSLLNFLESKLSVGNLGNSFDWLFIRPIVDGTNIIVEGSSVFALIGLMFMLFNQNSPLNRWAAAVYVYFNLFFLNIVNFLLSRHSYEVAPVGNLGIAILMSMLIDKLQVRSEKEQIKPNSKEHRAKTSHRDSIPIRVSWRTASLIGLLLVVRMFDSLFFADAQV